MCGMRKVGKSILLTFDGTVDASRPFLSVLCILLTFNETVDASRMFLSDLGPNRHLE